MTETGVTEGLRSHLNVVLYEPLIPQNTGSIARLCACTRAHLHLIHPLGFSIDEKSVKRAGLDYWDKVKVFEHVSWEAFIKTENPTHLYFFSKFSHVPYTEASFEGPCYLVFGNENGGLPAEFRLSFPDRFFVVPIQKEIVRSLNLAQCAAIVVYEVLRRDGFQDLTDAKMC